MNIGDNHCNYRFDSENSSTNRKLHYPWVLKEISPGCINWRSANVNISWINSYSSQLWLVTNKSVYQFATVSSPDNQIILTIRKLRKWIIHNFNSLCFVERHQWAICSFLSVAKLTNKSIWLWVFVSMSWRARHMAPTIFQIACLSIY